jgi:carnosine N-methyltransferase
MSMVAGEFTECYSDPTDIETFSVVATVFFLDTAANVLKYIDTIHHVLEPGGIWINLGPLAWHFEPDEQTAKSDLQVGGGIELSLDELITVIEKSGFTISAGENLDRRSIRTGYMGDPRGMLNYLYDADFWVAKWKVYDFTL